MQNENDILPGLRKFKKAVKVVWYATLIIGVSVFILVTYFNFSRILGLEQPGRLGIDFTTPGLILNVESDLLGGFLTPALISLEINMLCVLSLLLYSVNQFSKLFDTFLEVKTPFVADNVRRIKRIAYAFFIYSAVIFTANLFLKIIFLHSYSEIAVNGARIEINTTLPFWPVFCGIFVFGISKTFSYGAKLQQDNDSIV